MARPETLYAGGFQSLEKEVDDFRRKVTALAAQDGVDSAIVVMACADLVALTAAMLDRRDGTHTLDDRLHEFCGRVGRVYHRLRDVMEKAPPPGVT